MENNYIDVLSTFNPVVKTKGEFLNAPERVQEIIIEKLEESDLVLTYINNDLDLRVGDLVEVPFGRYGTNLAVVKDIPSKLGIKDGIEYKEVIQRVL